MYLRWKATNANFSHDWPVKWLFQQTYPETKEKNSNLLTPSRSMISLNLLFFVIKRTNSQSGVQWSTHSSIGSPQEDDQSQYKHREVPQISWWKPQRHDQKWTTLAIWTQHSSKWVSFYQPLQWNNRFAQRERVPKPNDSHFLNSAEYRESRSSNCPSQQQFILSNNEVPGSKQNLILIQHKLNTKPINLENKT